MRFVRLLIFTLRNLSRSALWQAGAEMVGGDVYRARAHAHARLRSMGAQALRAQAGRRPDAARAPCPTRR